MDDFALHQSNSNHFHLHSILFCFLPSFQVSSLTSLATVERLVIAIALLKKWESVRNARSIIRISHYHLHLSLDCLDFANRAHLKRTMKREEDAARIGLLVCKG